MHAGGSNCMPCCSRTKTPRGWVISQVGHGESKVTKEACVSQKRSKTRSGPSDSTIPVNLWPSEGGGEEVREVTGNDQEANRRLFPARA